MQGISTGTTVMAMLSLLLTRVPYAQPGPQWRGSGGWEATGPYSRMCNSSTVETLRGKVVKIERMTPMKGMGHGVHVLLKTAQETVSVHVGPAWSLEYQDLKIAPKDQVEVTGSRITFQGKPAMITTKVCKGGDILKPRVASGVPVWSAWRRGS